MSREKTWKEIAPAGVCPKSSMSFKTGDWKTFTPVQRPRKMHALPAMRDVLPLMGLFVGDQNWAK